MKNKKIYYIMDPICGWCYGFSDVITEIFHKYNKDFDFQLISGGMWIDENVQIPNPKLIDYIRSHNQRIESLTGKKFSENFYTNILGNSDTPLDSKPFAKAIVIGKQLIPDSIFDYTKDIQHEFFVNGLNVNSHELYMKLIEKYGLDSNQFFEKFDSSEINEQVYEEFDSARNLGVQSFPTILVEKNDEIYPLSQGYESFSELERKLKKLMI